MLAWVVVTSRLLDPQHRSLVLGVVGVVVAIAFEAIAVATAMPVNFIGNKLWTFQ